jgi:DNA ligase (NAD+)
MNIDGLSEATLEKFINAGLIRTFVDIYRLENHRSTIIKMDGFGVKSYDKLIAAIEKSKKVKMNNFLYALGIPTIGRSASKTISKYFGGDWFAFEGAIGNFNFAQLDDFGQTMHDNIYNWYMSAIEQMMWSKLTEAILEFEEFEVKPIVATDSQFSGKKIYATGTFRDYKKEEIKAVLEGLGAEFASGYAKSLDYLIVGSIKGSSKEDKAKKDGVTILSEDEFNKIIGR